MSSLSWDNFDEYARKGRIAECRDFLSRMRDETGGRAQYLQAVATLHSRQGEFQRALEVCQEISARFPEHANHRYLLAAAAAHVGDVAAIVTEAHRLGEVCGGWDGLQVRAELLYLAGLDERVIASVRRFDPSDSSANLAWLHRSQAVMRRHGIAAGLPDYAESWAGPRALELLYGKRDPSFIPTYWHAGRALPRKLMLRARGGFGDHFMWSRYAPLLRAVGVAVEQEHDPAPRVVPRLAEGDVAWLKDRLAPLTKACDPDVLWTDPFTLFCAMFPLVGYGPAGHYLHAAEETAAAAVLSEVRRRAGGRRAVGLFWSACESESSTFAAKSLTLEQVLPLLELRDIHWVVFQRGNERERWNGHAGAGDATNVEPRLGWSETAAVIEGLDAVVTIDSGFAHLAAALGKPTFALLAAAGDWRYERLPAATAWYEAMRLIRQPAPGDWASAVSAAASALQGA